jgi:hypothetical protein
VRKQSDLAEARKPIEQTFLVNFLYAHRGLRPNPQVAAELERLKEEYRTRCEDRQDINALVQYIEVCGEHALAAKWVQDRIAHTRWILKPDFPEWARLFAVRLKCPPETYLFDPNEPPLSVNDAKAFIAKMREDARDILYRIGPALANVGSGRPPEEKTDEESKQSGRERKQSFDSRERVARGKIQQELHAARKKLPREVWRNTQRLQEALRKISERVLSPYQSSKKAYEREAAKKEKNLIDQELKKFGM